MSGSNLRKSQEQLRQLFDAMASDDGSGLSLDIAAFASSIGRASTSSLCVIATATANRS